MHPVNDASRPAPMLTRAARTLLSATRSTLVVIVIALIVTAVRAGGISWKDIKYVLVANATLFGLVFLALCVWEGWRQRPRRKLVTD